LVLGFAIAQIDSMERYYQDLRSGSNPNVPALPSGAILNVSGYSLGGHLATVFTELHATDINRTFTFNAAGRGKLNNGKDLTWLLDSYRQLIADPMASIPGIAPPTAPSQLSLRDAAVASGPIQGNEANVYAHRRHQWATAALSPYVDGAASSSFGSTETLSAAANSKITSIYGMGANNDDTGTSLLGITPATKLRVFIEDQPDSYGSGYLSALGVDSWWKGDFLRTHSITLLADSIAVMKAFQAADAALTQLDIEKILASTSNYRGRSAVSYDAATTDSDSLEMALDELARLVLPGNDFEPLTADETPEGFSNLDKREAFYRRITEVQSALTDGEVSYRIVPIASMTWQQVEGFIPGRLSSAKTVPEMISVEAIVELASADSPEGLAYRYALREGNAFVLFGATPEATSTFYSRFNADHSLDLYDDRTGRGMSADYIESRAAFLAALLERNIRDASYVIQPASENVLYEDRRLVDDVSGVPVVTEILRDQARLKDGEEKSNVERNSYVLEKVQQAVGGGIAQRITFGSEDADHVSGGSRNDQFFGGDGDDTFDARGGNDYLEGGAGEDLLIGGSGDDTLHALDGAGGDRLRGGKGYDTFYVDWGDELSDDPEAPRSGIVYVGPNELQLSDGFRSKESGFFQAANGVRYWEGGDGRIVAYLPGESKQVVITAPSDAVPGRGDFGDHKISGRPDLGIRLVTQVEGRPRVESPESVWGQMKLAMTWRLPADPLALDLDGDGLEMLGGSGSSSTILFDHSGDGVRDGTGWLSGDDAWLALDLDSDGMITSGAELFGIDTILPDGAKAANGFAALAPLDSNADGVISADDERFADLVLWRDENLNGVSESFELRGLADSGIAAIGLNSQPVALALAGGNVLTLTSSFERTDGTNGLVGAIDLVREAFYSDFSLPPASADADGALPNIAGSGRVRDLA